MGKKEFLAQLRKKLSGLPQEDIEESVLFYSEMIEDRMEEGVSEEEAVSAAGSIDDIAAQIVAETPLVKIARERLKPTRRRSAGEIVLLILGSPIWLSLVIAAFAVIFSLYVSLWAVIVSAWAVFISLAVCAAGGGLACAVYVGSGNAASGLAALAAGMVCAGLSIFMFYGCRALAKGMLIFTKKTAIWMKKCFIKKEAAL